MADPKNQGQFGNRPDTVEQAVEGGHKSTGSFGSKNGADPHKEGKKGAKAQSTADKRKGGENSHRSSI